MGGSQGVAKAMAMIDSVVELFKNKRKFFSSMGTSLAPGRRCQP